MSDINAQLAELGAELRDDNTQDDSNNDLDNSGSSDTGGDDNIALDEQENDNEVGGGNDGSEAEAEEITTVSGLADAIGWSPEELYKINIGMGDGVDPVSLGALKDKFQESERSGKASTAEIERLTAELNTANAPGGNVAMNGELMNANAQLMSIQQQYNSQNWQQLEDDDPGQAALLRQKFNDVYNQTQGTINNIQQGMQANQQQRLAQGAQRLHELIPSWSDSSVMQKGQEAIRGVLTTAGYTDDMINQMDDPIAISLINELVILRSEKAAGTDAVKKVRNAPRVLKGVNKPGKNGNIDALAKKAKVTGDRNDKVAAVRALLS